MTKQLPVYGLIALMLFVTGWTVNGWRLNGQISDIRANHATALAEAESKARAEEQRRIQAIEEVREDAEREIAALAADVVAANDDAGRLQQQVANLSRRPTSCPDAAESGAPDAIRVLFAELFEEADRSAQRMAEEADRSRIAGLACERAYDSLRF